jgi:uncharacterized membrane protein
MEMNIHNIMLLLAILTTGLTAGLFYGWTVSVIPGIEKVSNDNYLRSMQSINREILNPAFFAIFMGSLILLPLSTWLQYRLGVNRKFWLILSATMIYLIGTIGVTMFGNVPLNNILEATNIQALGTEEMKLLRQQYEGPWNRLNRVRTIFSVLSFMILLYAIIDEE